MGTGTFRRQCQTCLIKQMMRARPDAILSVIWCLKRYVGVTRFQRSAGETLFCSLGIARWDCVLCADTQCGRCPQDP